jgi:hypothetical protein
LTTLAGKACRWQTEAYSQKSFVTLVPGLAFAEAIVFVFFVVFHPLVFKFSEAAGKKQADIGYFPDTT